MEIERLNNKGNLSEQAYNKIKQMIINEELRQGEIISINSMTQILNISRTPITNACQKLEYENFLTIVPKQGVIVNSITIDDAREIYELRAAIETYSAKKAFETFTKEDIQYLKNSFNRQRQYVEEKNVHEFMKEDTDFHLFLLKKYNNTSFYSIIDNLYDRALILGRKSGQSEGRLKENLNEHRMIIQALEKGDKNAFIEAVELNIINGYKNLTGNYEF